MRIYCDVIINRNIGASSSVLMDKVHGGTYLFDFVSTVIGLSLHKVKFVKFA